MKVMLAMSGGVDSSVAGALLLEQGHEVVGVTMRLWGGESDSGCCSVSDVDDARRVAQQLNIDHLVFNFSDDFNTHVVDPYVSAHSDGITPNPCIECNRHLKFDRLSERARLLGFDAVATGHHARIARGVDGLFELRRGEDRPKDQSYVVHMLPQHELAFTLFPVGEMTKAEVRTRAAALNLRTAAKPDSQDVCFITATGGGREAFLGHRIPFRRAVVQDTSGEQVGEVDSIELVTLGQRRGLQLAGAPARRYVVDIDHTAGVVTVGDEADLLVASERIDQLVWSRHEVDGEVLVQCSAHGDPRPARLRLLDGDGDVGDVGGDGRRSAVVEWHEPQRRISPGQSAVFYAVDDDLVLGGGLVARP
jgi:tRNA-uridine 2-sulfurtransferase